MLLKVRRSENLLEQQMVQRLELHLDGTLDYLLEQPMVRRWELLMEQR